MYYYSCKAPPPPLVSDRHTFHFRIKYRTHVHTRWPVLAGCGAVRALPGGRDALTAGPGVPHPLPASLATPWFPDRDLDVHVRQAAHDVCRHVLNL